MNIPAGKSNLSFIGQDYKKVFISDDRLSGGDNAVHVDEGATVVARAKDLFFEGTVLLIPTAWRRRMARRLWHLIPKKTVSYSINAACTVIRIRGLRPVFPMPVVMPKIVLSKGQWTLSTTAATIISMRVRSISCARVAVIS